MKAWQVEFGGGLESLRAVEMTRPRPGPREVLVRMRAVSLNRRELSILAGRYPLPVKPTLIPACDGAGEVVDIGAYVTDHAIGDRVIGAVFPEWRDGDFSLDVAGQLGGALDGTLAEYVCLDEGAAVPIPDAISFEQASTLPCAGVTAWHALRAGKAGGATDTVLSLTSGVVSLFALRLAVAEGKSVLVGTRSASHASALREFGADDVLPMDETLPRRVLDRTDGSGVDLVVHNGGPLAASVSATRMAGQVSLVSTTDAGVLDPALPFARNVVIRPICLGTVRQTRELVDFVAAHNLTMPVATKFDFDDARDAFAYYATQRPFGKVVIRDRGRSR